MENTQETQQKTNLYIEFAGWIKPSPFIKFVHTESNKNLSIDDYIKLPKEEQLKCICHDIIAAMVDAEDIDWTYIDIITEKRPY